MSQVFQLTSPLQISPATLHRVVFFPTNSSLLLAFWHHAPSLTITDQIKRRIVTRTLHVTAFPSQGQHMTPVAHSSIKDCKVHHFSSPAQTWGLLYPAPGSANCGMDSGLPYSMAAAEGVAHASDCRTTWPPTESAPHPLPPGRRKFPFETLAADAVRGTAVTAEHLLNQSDEACGQEQQAPGFGSPGAGNCAGCGKSMGWAGNGGFSLS